MKKSIIFITLALTIFSIQSYADMIEADCMCTYYCRSSNFCYPVGAFWAQVPKQAYGISQIDARTEMIRECSMSEPAGAETSIKDCKYTRLSGQDVSNDSSGGRSPLTGY